MSLPVRGAWIEIYIWTNKTLSKFLSLPVRGAWIEISPPDFRKTKPGASLPVRGAWIEIAVSVSDRCFHVVAPRAGSVD